MTTPGSTRECPVCGGPATLVFERPVLGRFLANYFLCGNCEFVCARPGDWLAEAYSSALAITDTGAVSRSIVAAEFLSTFAWVAGFGRARGLDVGGGHGLLVRMLRDRGLDFRWIDEHAENLFARGFDDDGQEYEWVTMVEVFEHLLEPGAFLSELVRRRHPRAIFLTTVLRPAVLPPPEWHYWNFETGQHVGFATHRSLEALGTRLGYRVASRGAFHLLYREPRLKLAFTLAGSPLRDIHRFFALRCGPSLTMTDHDALAKGDRNSTSDGLSDGRGP